MVDKKYRAFKIPAIGTSKNDKDLPPEVLGRSLLSPFFRPRITGAVPPTLGNTNLEGL